MARLQTPSRYMGRQRHQIATERNQQRITDRLPPDVVVDRSDGDMSVGNITDMAASEGSSTATRPGQGNTDKSKQFDKA